MHFFVGFVVKHILFVGLGLLDIVTFCSSVAKLALLYPLSVAHPSVNQPLPYFCLLFYFLFLSCCIKHEFPELRSNGNSIFFLENFGATQLGLLLESRVLVGIGR